MLRFNQVRGVVAEPLKLEVALKGYRTFSVPNAGTLFAIKYSDTIITPSEVAAGARVLNGKKD